MADKSSRKLAIFLLNFFPVIGGGMLAVSYLQEQKVAQAQEEMRYAFACSLNDGTQKVFNDKAGNVPTVMTDGHPHYHFKQEYKADQYQRTEVFTIPIKNCTVTKL